MSVKQSIFLAAPKDFRPTLDVAACYVEHGGSTYFSSEDLTILRGIAGAFPREKPNPANTPIKGFCEKSKKKPASVFIDPTF